MTSQAINRLFLTGMINLSSHIPMAIKAALLNNAAIELSYHDRFFEITRCERIAVVPTIDSFGDIFSYQKIRRMAVIAFSY